MCTFLSTNLIFNNRYMNIVYFCTWMLYILHIMHYIFSITFLCTRNNCNILISLLYLSSLLPCVCFFSVQTYITWTISYYLPYSPAYLHNYVHTYILIDTDNFDMYTKYLYSFSLRYLIHQCYYEHDI